MSDPATEQAPPTPDDAGPDYAVIEIFGHRRLAGRVVEVEKYGTRLLRIDIPEKGKFENGFTTQMYGGASLFSVTPCDLATVERMKGNGYTALTSAREVTDEASLSVLPDGLAHVVGSLKEIASLMRSRPGAHGVLAACVDQEVARLQTHASAPQPACVGVGWVSAVTAPKSWEGEYVWRWWKGEDEDVQQILLAKDYSREPKHCGQIYLAPIQKPDPPTSLSPAPSPQAGGETISGLGKFFADIFHAACEGNDLSGGQIQDLGVATGLLVVATYDPVVHGDNYDCDPGDDIFVYSDELKTLRQSLSAMATERQLIDDAERCERLALEAYSAWDFFINMARAKALRQMAARPTPAQQEGQT